MARKFMYNNPRVYCIIRACKSPCLMSDTSKKNASSPPVWTASDVIKALTARVELFIFSYSARSKALLSWSENADKILGVKDSAIARDGNLFLRHVHPDDRFLLLSDLEHALKDSRTAYRATYRWIRPDNNEVRWLHCRASMKDAESGIFEGIVMDLSQEFTGQVARIAGPDSIASILAAFPTMVFTVDNDLRILRVNRPPDMLSFNFGDNDFHLDQFRIGRPLLSCFKDNRSKNEYAQIFNQLLEGKRNHHRQRVLVDETVYSLEISPLVENKSIEGLLFVISDVSEIVNLERELANLQKQEGLRLLAAGVSHNFNNSLQSIISQAALIRNHPTKTQLVQQASQEIIDVVNRTSELSKQLFAYDSQEADILVPVDLNLAAMAAANKTENLFATGLKVSVAFGTPQPVMASQDKLVQAIIEILKNAKESMPQGGTLSIRTYQVYLSDEEVSGLRAGSYAKISISDSGEGMPQEVKDRCLEPFYTTKEQDAVFGLVKNDNGLGLSRAFATARDFSGMIVIESQKGLGTVVSMFLPIQESGEITAARGAVLNNASHLHPSILIIDDDLMVLKTAKQILEDEKIHCVVAEEPRRALALAQRFKSDLRVVLLDAVMPGMDGASLLKRIKRIAPAIKAIGFSGATPEQINVLKNAGAIEVLKKPVDPELLKKVVLGAIESRQAA